MAFGKYYENAFIIRLMILYAMREYGKPLTNPDLTKFIIDNNEVDFFDLQYNIYELVKLEEIYGYKENDNYMYRLTGEGKESIGFFENKIPLVIRGRIKKTVEEQLKSEAPKTGIICDYTPEGKEFLTSVKMLENGVEQFGVSFLVPERDMAKAVCEYLKHNVGDIYEYVNKNIEKMI